MLTPLDPVSQLVLGRTLDRAVDLIGTQVVKRWADHRAKRFIEQFVEQVAGLATGSGDPQAVEGYLERLLDDEEKSAALYDAFRHVLLSASREIGPRVIGLHMANVIAGEVDDAEVSDMIMTGAGSLLDVEFRGFVRYAAANGLEARSFKESTEDMVVVRGRPVEFVSTWRGRRQGTGPLNLRLEVGSWAQKLSRVGLIAQDISEEEFDFDADDERHIDEPGSTRRIHRNIELREGTSYLFLLAERVLEGAASRGS